MKSTEYKALREKLGTQGEVAALLGVSRRTINTREASVHPIPKEAEFAIRWAARNAKEKAKQ